ncbi:glycosyltransferase family 2 protein [uncultured Roseobacter sp.]|uniref:glycosyltransferase family 2 protein n=1 Tax=uncultured Roseobacter sp. TaxID=114847 RepID=UPI00262FEA2E|nr:glycosyltransferase family 2 protein [uncultured Roseobacter sp.]
MPKASVIVPAFNSETTLAETLLSLLAQSFQDFEILVVNDGSADSTLEVANAFRTDPRIRVLSQANRGLAGARNTGIDQARGEYVGFCDADDVWMPDKLMTHVNHLDSAPDVGLSFSGSAFIDAQSRPTGLAQKPRLRNITARHVLCRNPVGNGSAAVMRRQALADIAWRPATESRRDWYFDETFRQSEDIECWLRLMLTTDWEIEGVPGLLTGYRVNPEGLSSATERQLAAWELMIAKLRPFNPAFFDAHLGAARAYQLRYLARRAVSAMDGDNAWPLIRRALASSTRPVFEEPLKSGVTIAAAAVLRVLGPKPVRCAARLIASRPGY